MYGLLVCGTVVVRTQHFHHRALIVNYIHPSHASLMALIGSVAICVSTHLPLLSLRADTVSTPALTI